MIYTNLNNLERYLGMRKHLDTAIHYIKEHSLNDLKKGCNEVDGDFAFINCFEYETLPEEKTFFEAHEKYADIHMVISGEEKMGVSDMSLMTVTAKDEETEEGKISWTSKFGQPQLKTQNNCWKFMHII